MNRVLNAVKSVKRWVAACIGLGLIALSLVVLTNCAVSDLRKDMEDIKSEIRVLKESLK